MEILTVKECAEKLKITERTVRSLIANREFCPVKRIGKSLRVVSDDLDIWINSREDKLEEYARKKNKRFVRKITNLIKK